MNHLVRVFSEHRHALHSSAATRRLEQSAMALLAPHTLMQRAGLAVARLACAVAPHAQTIWVACGPGNNGGDGLEAAMHLQQWGRKPVVTLCAKPTSLPPDAAQSLQRALQAGISIALQPPEHCDLAIDALLGLGVSRPLEGVMPNQLLHMHRSARSVLAVDLPSGLNADTGNYVDSKFDTQLIANNLDFKNGKSIFCLNLLSLKPGVFTAQGKDLAGQVWWDDLGVNTIDCEPNAWLLGADCAAPQVRPHASHKGTWGDVAIIGGAPSMVGAALLAGRAALHAGAGRVLVSLLGDAGLLCDPAQPELMLRPLDQMDLHNSTVVCGCGGADSVRTLLPQVLTQSPRLVLDADALNAIATDTSLHNLLKARASRNQATILTPHPLEAARLLSCSTAQVQADRLAAAQELAHQFRCVVILKGAGSVIAAPGQVPCINPTGNARLATAGTGDVLAGLVGTLLAHSQTPFEAACDATYRHGQMADFWPNQQALTASVLATKLSA